MHASFLLGFLPLLVQGAAVAPSATAVPSASNITAVSGTAKRDNCGIGGSGIQPADIYSMVGDLEYNDPDTLRYVPHGNWIAWTVGSATICLFNDYLTENTHVSRWESGWAASFIQNECGCTSNACGGGTTTAHGDSGLALRAVLLSTYNDQCDYHK